MVQSQAAAAPPAAACHPRLLAEAGSLCLPDVDTQQVGNHFHFLGATRRIRFSHYVRIHVAVQDLHHQAVHGPADSGDLHQHVGAVAVGGERAKT